ncbi:MAG: VWA domain-containing protein [Actinobacteria bacterium]|uniref:Unannotated protein n=1 Tax=freshwater metagenome TaxID=449393 RepID=A0A6J6YB39_9ZZZZ|nr:VWA domain-containing protein [Actinomycetota bacterium]MSW05394.1 VWA domain-containing protein [Actinomycetota bacterium]MSX82435.1 VWA domain-containing protein [Actinomycetota bacterium]
MSTTPDPTSNTGADSTPTPAGVPVPVHLYVLIDVSGSMESIRTDVIGGFNALLEDQRAEAEDASRATVVLFDSVEPNNVIASGVPLREVIELDQRSYTPRGGTPLLDATGVLITRADREKRERADAGLPAEDILFVTITDGHENQSTEFTRDAIKTLVEQRQADGWEFSFLSADLEAFDDARAMGYDQGRMTHFSKSPSGTRSAFANTSQLLSAKKQALRDLQSGFDEDRKSDPNA